ncbi:ABC transporter ATP-binding protein [Oxalobacter sp. OttesenSCG-928-P03]|nr:ABC transporter ATP-binding protein [Oxalobacter sp. OttesenSCG-928-P03]
MLELIGAGKNYQRGGVSFAAVDEVSLSMQKGDFLSIIGRSGSGKTTLLNMIAGILKPDRGEIRFLGEGTVSLDDTAMSALRNREMGYVPQGASLLPNFSVLDNVRLPYYLSGKKEDDATGRAHYLLEEVGLLHLADAYPAELSGGETRRVAIARALINAPQILIADEPTSDLDVVSIQGVMDLLVRIHQRGTALLLVTHELDTAAFSQRVALMRSGRVSEVEKRSATKEGLVALLAG